MKHMDEISVQLEQRLKEEEAKAEHLEWIRSELEDTIEKYEAEIRVYKSRVWR